MRRILSYAACLAAPHFFSHYVPNNTFMEKIIQTQNQQHPEALAKLFKSFNIL
jgi:hypothetical protein